MGYRNGIWVSDGSPDPRPEKGKGYKREESDLDRVIRDEQRTQIGGGPAKPQTYEKGGAGLMNGITNTGTHTSGSAFVGTGTKIDRPIVVGGCQHTGVKVAITLSDGKRLYGARGMDIKAAGHLDLIIDCAGLVNARRFVKASNNPRYRALNPFAWPDVITLAWPDMTAPSHVGIRFWVRLREMIPQDTAVCCMGGHGRTGTALACLLVADGVGGQAAIDRVRKEHCARAIETREQENYIRELATHFAHYTNSRKR